MYQAQYIRSLTETVTRAFESQQAPLSLAGQMLAETVRDRHNVFVFGCSHAGILAEEPPASPTRASALSVPTGAP